MDVLAWGMTTGDVLNEYPQLTADDVLACIAFAAEMTRERTVHVA